MGFDAHAALEYEFFMFKETPESVRAKGYRDLQTWTPGYFGYSTLRNSVNAEFYHELMQLCERMDMPIEGLHTETGPGVVEAALTVDEAGAMADKAMLFKTFVKVLAQRLWLDGDVHGEMVATTIRARAGISICRCVTGRIRVRRSTMPSSRSP